MCYLVSMVISKQKGIQLELHIVVDMMHIAVDVMHGECILPTIL